MLQQDLPVCMLVNDLELNANEKYLLPMILEVGVGVNDGMA
jgi:hypothetical protein